jgi:hypothetical protein
MILRVDRLQIELPMPSEPDPPAAAAVQELLGGRFGEMSTLMNYTFQSFNFRGRAKAKPFYDLIANIATEEYGHIELVSAVINGLLTGAAEGEDVILVRPFTEADDVAGFHAAKGILTSEGGKASHAALVARGMWKPCVSPAIVLRKVEQPEPGGPKTTSISPELTTPSKSLRMSMRLWPRLVEKSLRNMPGVSTMTLPTSLWWSVSVP